MGIAQYDPAALGRPAWNAGRQIGVEKPLKAAPDLGNPLLPRPRRMDERSCAVRSRHRQQAPRLRSGQNPNRTLVTGQEVRTRATVVQQKTGRPRAIRAYDRGQGKSACRASAKGRNSRSLCLPKPSRSCRSSQHSAKTPGWSMNGSLPLGCLVKITARTPFGVRRLR